ARVKGHLERKNRCRALRRRSNSVQQFKSGADAVCGRTVVAQSDVHENAAARGLEAEHERFRVGSNFWSMLRGVQVRGMYAEVEALIIQSSDGVPNHLVGQFADRLTNQ